MENGFDMIMSGFAMLPMSVQFAVMSKATGRAKMAILVFMEEVDEVWNERGSRGPYQKWADEHPVHWCAPMPIGDSRWDGEICF